MITIKYTEAWDHRQNVLVASYKNTSFINIYFCSANMLYLHGYAAEDIKYLIEEDDGHI